MRFRRTVLLETSQPGRRGAAWASLQIFSTRDTRCGDGGRRAFRVRYKGETLDELLGLHPPDSWSGATCRHDRTCSRRTAVMATLVVSALRRSKDLSVLA